MDLGARFAAKRSDSRWRREEDALVVVVGMEFGELDWELGVAQEGIAQPTRCSFGIIFEQRS